MKLYLFKDEKLKLEVTDPRIVNKKSYSVFQMETPVAHFQPSNDRDDPEQKQFCAEIMKKLCHLVESESTAVTKGKSAAGIAGTAMIRKRTERNPNLKILFCVPNKVCDNEDEDDEENHTRIKIVGEFITALRALCLSLPKAKASVKLTLLTDLESSPVITDEMCINGNTDYCRYDFYLSGLLRKLIIPTNGKKLTKIGGKFTIEIRLQNFKEKLVKPSVLNQTILNEAESADVVICTGDGKEIPCHRVFLAVNSLVLKAMLRSSFKESSGRINMPDISEQGVRAFLAFIYSRDLSPAKKKISIVWELLNAGEKYNVIPLRTAMEKILLEINDDSWWTVEVALQIFAFVDEIDSDLKEDVKKKILQVMRRNDVKWMSSEVYQKMMKENSAIISKLLKASFSLISSESDSDDE